MRPFLPAVPFARGVNLPWLSYGNDFGRNAWHPLGGLSHGVSRAELEALFARLAGAGVHVVRWFLLCDGRAGLCEDDDGGPGGLDDSTFQDLRAAVATAEACGVGLLPVLLDFHWCRPSFEYEGVRCAGRTRHLSDSGFRTRLLQHVLRPLLSRFGGRTGIVGWDLINEPEWVTFSWRAWDPRQTVLPDVMGDFIGEAAALVHECTDHPVTVGLAHPASLPLVRGLGLDLLQVHYYDRFETEAPLATPVSAWGMAEPVLLGEFPSRGSRVQPAAFEAAARATGYAGALAWSLQASDSATDAQAVWEWLERSPTALAAPTRTTRFPAMR